MTCCYILILLLLINLYCFHYIYIWFSHIYHGCGTLLHCLLITSLRWCCSDTMPLLLRCFPTRLLPLHSMNFPLRNMIVRKYWGATRILYLEQERLWWKVLFIANCFCSDFCLPNLWFDSTFYLKYLELKVIIINVTKWYDMVRPFLRKLLPIHHIGRWTKYRLFCIHKLI